MNSQKPLQILIAEDDFFVCKDIERAVKSVGFNVLGIAPNGQKAVEMTSCMNPDLILMDVQMPVMDGLEATQIIQEVHPTPVVVLTAHETKDLLEKASKVGVGAYLTKPPKPSEIERAVSIAMARHKDWQKMCELNNQLRIEISNRHEAEKSLRGLLKEKEILLKEVHHRVKNNFSVIASLLNLQMGQVKNFKMKDILKVSRDRVKSMAMIHQQLYQSDNLASIDFNQYIRNLTKTLFNTYNVDASHIHLRTSVEKITLGVDVAIPCGLIVNELLSNSFKHAFPSTFDGKGQITISLHRIHENNLELSIKDNGIGIPEDIDIYQTDSLGMKLVIILAEDQLNGQVKLDRSEGSQFTITFSDQEPKDN